MHDKLETYIIAGRTIPFRVENDYVPLAEISVNTSRLDVVLVGNKFSPIKCSCEIWDHTFYELELLSASLRCAAGGPFPAPVEVRTSAGGIALDLKVPVAVSIELGYSLRNPMADRASIYCSSGDWGFREEAHRVAIGIGLSGRYGEVVLEPMNVIEMADWIDSQVARVHS